MKKVLSLMICLLMFPQNASTAEIQPADIDYRYEGMANSESLSHGFVVRDQDAKKIRLKVKSAIPVALKFSQPVDAKSIQSIQLAAIENKTSTEKRIENPMPVPVRPSESNHVSCKKNIVFFPFDGFQIGDAQRDQIKQFIDCIRGREVKVTGYTCRIGNKFHNEQLAKARADSVAMYLRQEGVIVKEITGRGQQEYISGVNHINRRVEIEQK